MNGLLYDSEGFKAAVAGEANINNLYGWADDYVGTRYTRFTNNTFFLWQDWPLLEGYDITNTQANAIESAFTDFIWEKIQNE